MNASHQAQLDNRAKRIAWLVEEATRCAHLCTRFGWYEGNQCRTRMQRALDDAQRLKDGKPTRHVWMTGREWLPQSPRSISTLEIN